MSSLSRYKKSGGFFQLLSLIETFGPQKREKFLEMIEAESPVWAKALREKMLTLERLFQWPEDTVVTVFKHLPPKSLAYALQGLKEEQRQVVQKYLSVAEQRRLADVLSESQPKAEEIAATLVKVVEIARKMLHEREINPEKFDAKLLIPEDFEARLEDGGGFTEPGGSGVSAAAASASVNAVLAQEPSTLETAQLQRTLSLAVKENKALKEEVRLLRDKLEQIRRIA